MKQLNAADFTPAHARHLMRRSLMGPTPKEVADAYARGLEATLDILFTAHAVDMKPVQHLVDKDVLSDLPPYDTPQYRTFLVEKNDRYTDVKQWWYACMVQSPTSIQERMVLFWHSLIPVQFNGSHFAEFVLDYTGILRENALGDVGGLMRGVSTSLAMQLYMNDTSSEWHEWFNGINENHAREMLELHFMGRDDRYGNPNYSQHDIKELARCLSGWRLNYRWEDTSDPKIKALMNTRYATWRADYWDPREKTLFGATAAFDTWSAIDHVLEAGKAKVARHVCKKLYNEFVNHDVDEDIVDVLAEHLIANDMQIAPTLRMLLASEHFYEPQNRMSLVQSPIRWVLGLLRSTSVYFVPDFDSRYHRSEPDLVMRLSTLGHSIGQPPNVSGWVSGKGWLSAPAIIKRMTFAKKFAMEQVIPMDYNSGHPCHRFDVDDFISSLQTDGTSAGIASALCAFFVDSEESSATEPIRAILKGFPADERRRRQALMSIFQSFRAQLY